MTLHTTRRSIELSVVAFLVAVFGAAGMGRSAAAIALPPARVTDIAEEAFIYGFPLVMNYKVFHDYFLDSDSGSFKVPLNTLHSEARVYTPEDVGVQTPNSDTPYSMLGADLRAEPLVLCMPEVDEPRYYSVQLVDMYTHNYGYIGSRTTGNDAGCFLLAGPGWSGPVPPGIERVFRCETPFSFVIYRTQLFDADDLGNVERIQAGYSVQPLSTFLKQPAPPAPPAIDWPAAGKESFTTAFPETLDFLLGFLPPVGPASREEPLRERLASIGIGPDATVRLQDLTPDQRRALGAGLMSGAAKLDQAATKLGTRLNGWQIGSAAGSREFFDGDWLLRAVGSKLGIYGNDAAEATYPFTKQDADGDPLDGSAHTYTLTFPASQLPPVNAFWSMTMYDARTQLLVDNPINRYLINSPMLPNLLKNDDGSLTLYVQRDSPGPDKEVNWLPAPDGPIFLVMRLYWPKETSPSVLPPGRGSWQPPPVAKSGAVAWVPGDKIRRKLRAGDKPRECVLITDERYGQDALFQGPRGWPYWNDLPNPKPIQNPNLWPDTQSTYFVSHFVMPAGSTLTVKSRFPRARYFQFALYKAEHNTFVSIGEALSGPDIEPDPGSVNPFRIGADRRTDERDFQLRIIADDPPAGASSRQTNAMYVGKAGGELQGVIRVYLPDKGWDGAGWAPLDATAPEPAFQYEATLADGTPLSQEEVVQRFAKPMTGATRPPISTEQWVALVRSTENDPALDPAAAPARRTPNWEKYWGIPYSIVGAFKPPAERAKIPFGGAIDGGGDPSTQYFLTHLSREFGPVYVMSGRMPTFPDTFADPGGEGMATMPETQTQYWSLVSCEAPPSGRIVDGVCDMQVPLDPDRNYTIVFSRAEDRPVNATIQNGVAWLEWSPLGEGLDHPQNRENFGMLMLRIMATNPDWDARPDRVTTPGSEESVMGDYLPRGRYMTKEEFEARGAAAGSQ